MTSVRRCDNWLLAYRDYILPRTDAPESFVFWSGVFAISSVLRRRVKFPKRILGLWDCYPHMYLMFVGPPGMRKTTAIEHGTLPLLAQTDGLKEGPTFFTKEAVLEKMQQTADNSIYMVVGEFSDIFQKAGKDRSSVYEFFTRMYDGMATLDSATKTQGNVLLVKPSINFVSATTPGWITDNMPEGVISGGFASRCIWVYAEQLRINKMFFDDIETNLDLENDLLLDLLAISKLEGEFTWSDDGKAAMKDWETQDTPQFLKNNDKLGGYINRRRMHTLKLAMLHSVMEKNELVIEKRDWDFATHAISTIEPDLPKIFGGVGKNPFTSEIEKIVAYVRNMNFFSKEAVPLDEILRAFAHSARPRELRDLIDYAVDSKQIIHVEAKMGEHVFYTPDFLAEVQSVGK